MHDFVHACVSTSVFLSLALLTDPVAVCYFDGHLPAVVKQAVPPIVAGTASVIFSFFGPPRCAVGFPGSSPDDSADGGGGASFVVTEEQSSKTQIAATIP